MASKRTCDDNEVGEQAARKKIKRNTRYAKQIKRKIQKWYTETNTPACVIYLRGGNVMCEGPDFLKRDFGNNVSVQKNFLAAVLNNGSCLQPTASTSTAAINNFPVRLPPAGRNYKVTDLRRIVSACVTTGREGYVPPNWGKQEYRPCWWPREITFASPCTGRSNLLKRDLLSVMESYRSFYAGGASEPATSTSDDTGSVPPPPRNARTSEDTGSMPTLLRDAPTSEDTGSVPPPPRNHNISEDTESVPSPERNASTSEDTGSVPPPPTNAPTSEDEGSVSPPPRNASTSKETVSVSPPPRITSNPQDTVPVNSSAFDSSSYTARLLTLGSARENLKHLLLSLEENYLDQGKKLLELLQEMVSQFHWSDVVEILKKVQYLLPVFRRKKRVTITREDIDIKYRFAVQSQNTDVKLEPLKSTGDGNCLFNSLSLLIHGTEILAPVLRALSFFYGAIHVSELEKWIVKDHVDPSNPDVTAFFTAYCSGTLRPANITDCLVSEAKETLKLGLYAGYLQVVFAAGALQSTIDQYSMQKTDLLEEYAKPVTPPGAVRDRLGLKIFWVLKDLCNADSLANHVVPLIPVTSELFNTECKSMDECAAGMFCQRFHNGADLNNGTSTIEAECELCLQWFHSECVTFNPQDIGKEDLYCGCHIEDMWEDTIHEELQSGKYFLDALRKMTTRGKQLKQFIGKIVNQKVASKRRTLYPLEPSGKLSINLVSQVTSFLNSNYRLPVDKKIMELVVLPEILVWVLTTTKDVARNTGEEILRSTCLC